jgi:hypothetical protein
MPSFGRISTSKPDNWHSVLQPAKEALITLSVISDIRMFERDGFLAALQSYTKSREKSFLRSSGHVLRLRERGRLIPDCWQQMIHGSIISNRRQKVVHGKASSSVCLGVKLRIVFNSGQGQNHRLLGLWRSDYCGRCQEGKQFPMPTAGRWKNSGSISYTFSSTSKLLSGTHRLLFSGYRGSLAGGTTAWTGR